MFAAFGVGPMEAIVCLGAAGVVLLAGCLAMLILLVKNRRHDKDDPPPSDSFTAQSK